MKLIVVLFRLPRRKARAINPTIRAPEIKPSTKTEKYGEGIIARSHGAFPGESMRSDGDGVAVETDNGVGVEAGIVGVGIEVAA